MSKPLIDVIGLGGGDMDQLPLGIYRKLAQSEQVCYVRTMDHPVVTSLEQEGVHFYGFDSVYEKHGEFESVYEEIVSVLIEKALDEHQIIYAVPGHPMLAERTVQLLLESDRVDVRLAGGQSFLDDMFRVFQFDPIEGFQFVDATSFQRYQLQYEQHIVFCQVYDSFIASEVKLELLEDLPPNHMIYIAEAVGSRQESLKHIPLVELDMQAHLSNLTSVYVPPVDKSELNHQFFRLREVVATLRGPGGCPWDQKQTHESLKKYLIEETYEVLEAIDREDDEAIAEELGDVLLQVMLHSQIAEESGYFTIEQVINSITEKMIRRHPHVFGDTVVQDENDVMVNWEAIKKQEKQHTEESLLDNITKGLPAMLMAEEIQKKAAKVGFDWDNAEDMWAKVEEEINEWKEAISTNDEKEMAKEFGDILFAMINIARYYKINPETALLLTNEKFKKRFHFVEQSVKASNKDWDSFTLEQLDKFWEEAKQEE
ncbi:tetrapyrrole methylase family protein / MazG family protein [Gracilibacillus ureilyticus]|uniref:Tetrapyrrole methylase family protein / MazG family protein n=1 Tax=Gracilibacillus ureilyticus TaxID=531814 RepID=A0A1H9VMK2_9BACI|nr:nucleoside triphosphate pyrophosphohydrolase [Gracilibacillus ureilyticus]SES22809.1 tetrapyrrole methylase family protein / MazG family protein [Gracilibacillus ureilyticus]